MTQNQRAALFSTAIIGCALLLAGAFWGLMWVIDALLGQYGLAAVMFTGLGIFLLAFWFYLFYTIRRLPL